VDRGGAELWRDGGGDVLDAAGVGAFALGFAGQRCRVAQILCDELLDQQLLGRGCGCSGRCPIAGSAGRIVRKPRSRDAALFALGLAILANSRPYEGFLFSLPAGIYLFYGLFARVRHLQAVSRWKIVFLPMLAVLIPTVVAMAIYNHSLTGHVLVFPETLNVRTYHTAPMFLFQASKPPLRYHNQQFEEFYNGWEREEYDHTWESVKCLTWLKTVRFFSAFGWWGMYLAAPGIYWVLRNPRQRLLWIMLGLVAAGLTSWCGRMRTMPRRPVVL
jgi:hypothetical protein